MPTIEDYPHGVPVRGAPETMQPLVKSQEIAETSEAETRVSAKARRGDDATWPRRPRIAVFTHDTYGLGHMRRCMRLVRGLSEKAPEAAILIVTGSTALHVFKTLPPNADFVKIPTIVQTGSDGSKPPHLPLEVKEISAFRKRLVQKTLTTFAPHVFLVDNFPLGSRKELLPTLEMLRSTATRTVLGLRDIVDHPEVVRYRWQRDGIYDALECFYDRILVYGIPEVFEVIDAYGLNQGIGSKVHYCGYVADVCPTKRTREQIHAELGISGPLIVATVGGGGDGLPLLRAYLGAIRNMSGVSSLVVTGPLMGPVERAEIESLTEGVSQIVVREFVSDLPDYMGAADLVVAMGGYNTTAELITLKRRAIIVPRDWRYGEYARRGDAAVEWEQILRAQALEAAGLADLVHPDDLGPELLQRRIEAALAKKTPLRSLSFDTGGVDRVTKHLLTLAGEVEGVAREHV